MAETLQRQVIYRNGMSELDDTQWTATESQPLQHSLRGVSFISWDAEQDALVDCVQVGWQLF